MHPGALDACRGNSYPASYVIGCSNISTFFEFQVLCIFIEAVIYCYIRTVRVQGADFKIFMPVNQEIGLATLYEDVMGQRCNQTHGEAIFCKVIRHVIDFSAQQLDSIETI